MGFDKDVTNNEIYDYCEPRSRLQMDQAEYSSKWTKMEFSLSSAQYMNGVKKIIRQSFKDFNIEGLGNCLTVSGYPPDPNFVEDDVLTIVRTLDPHAQKIDRPETITCNY